MVGGAWWCLQTNAGTTTTRGNSGSLHYQQRHIPVRSWEAGLVGGRPSGASKCCLVSKSICSTNCSIAAERGGIQSSCTASNTTCSFMPIHLGEAVQFLPASARHCAVLRQRSESVVRCCQHVQRSLFTNGRPLARPVVFGGMKAGSFRPGIDVNSPGRRGTMHERTCARSALCKELNAISAHYIVLHRLIISDLRILTVSPRGRWGNCKDAQI